MRNALLTPAKFAIALAFLSFSILTCFAGKRQNWEEVPESVRKTILANGGKAGPVDKENEKIDGKTVFEASITDKKGVVSDLVVTSDGKLVTIKTDDAADRREEQSARAKKLLSGVHFTHPKDIVNPFLPLASLKQDVLEGTEDGKKVRIERTALPRKSRTFLIAGQKVEALVVEDREYEDGELAEVATDYFAQDDNGAVYYLGEEVDEYEHGKVKSHQGSWMLGKDTQIPGIILPAHPKKGDRFKSEDVSQEINESDIIVSVSETVTVPAGTYQNCVKVKETLADGTTEYKYYASGIGVVREVPPKGDVVLKTHSTQ